MWFSVIGTTETGLYSLLSFLQNPGLMMVLVRDKAGAVFSNLKSPRQWARLKLWGPSHLHQGRAELRAIHSLFLFFKCKYLDGKC